MMNIGHIIYWKVVCLILFQHIILLQAYQSFHQTSKSILNSLKVAKTPYIDALISSNNLYKHRYFFPGHSGGKFGDEMLSKIGLKEALQYDLPEMDELGDLHSLEGPIRESMNLCSTLFGSTKCWYLVNGSTSGIHISIFALYSIFKSKFKRNPYFLVSRDSHKSVFDAIKLSGSKAIILPCDYDNQFGIKLGTNYSRLSTILNEHGHEIAGVVITRPSYQGLMLKGEDLGQIIEQCHNHHVPVIIDEAHGSHLKFLKSNTSLDSLSWKGDLVVQSTHKSLHSLSQTALLHLGSLGSTVGIEDSQIIDVIHSIYSSFTSTSPNSLLLASLDALQANFHDQGRQMVEMTSNAVQTFKQKLKLKNKNICFLEDSIEVKKRNLIFDPLRLSIHIPSSLRTTQDFDNILCEEFGIYSELNLDNCVTYAIPIGTNEKDLLPLEEAFSNLPQDPLELNSIQEGEDPISYQEISYCQDESIYLINKKYSLSLLSEDGSYNSDLIGKTSAETISIYPPGIPLIIRGEKITPKHLIQLQKCHENLVTNKFKGKGFSVTGNSDDLLKTIQIIRIEEDNNFDLINF